MHYSSKSMHVCNVACTVRYWLYYCKIFKFQVTVWIPFWTTWRICSLHPHQKKMKSNQPLPQHHACEKLTVFTCHLLHLLNWFIILLWMTCYNMTDKKDTSIACAKKRQELYELRPHTYRILLSIFPMGAYFFFCTALSWMKSDTSFSIWQIVHGREYSSWNIRDQLAELSNWEKMISRCLPFSEILLSFSSHPLASFSSLLLVL